MVSELPPAVNSVWRNGDEWRRVTSICDDSVYYCRFGSRAMAESTEWLAWVASGAVQVYPPLAVEQPSEPRLSDEEIYRIVDRLIAKMLPPDLEYRDVWPPVIASVPVVSAEAEVQP